MEEEIYIDGEQITLVIEQDEQIDFFSIAYLMKRHQDIDRMPVMDAGPDSECEALVFSFDPLDEPWIPWASLPYAVDVVLADRFDTIFLIATVPAHSSTAILQEHAARAARVIICPGGLLPERCFLPGSRKISIRSNSSYGSIYCQEVWSKELKASSDEELIQTFNRMTGIRNGGFGANAQRNAIGNEIHARPFDSSILFTHYPNGSIQSISFGKRVKLSNNRLEYE